MAGSRLKGRTLALAAAGWARMLLGSALLALAGLAWAERPLTVEDADTAEVGGGQLESWLARASDGSRVWTTSVGVGVWDGVELGAAYARNTRLNENTTALQAKFRLTPSVEGGCNLGAVLGVAHTDRGVGRDYEATGLLTCRLAPFTLHTNLGATRAQGGPTLASWGVAAEKAFGDLTAHLEAFGEQHGKPTVQVGLRKEILPNLQLDGTLGRAERRTVFSVGLMLEF